MPIQLIDSSVGCVLATILFFLSVKFALSFTRATDHFNSKSSAQQATPRFLSCDPSGTIASFTHVPLKHPRHFRILHLMNSLCGKDQILRGTLVETSLDDVPRYLALSYVWGDPSPIDVIFIDKQPLKITRSCGAGLRRMLKGKSEIKIWVDAICINQAGDTQAVQERSTQVAFMDEIYSKAVQVNVHLGEGDEKTDEAMKAAKRLAAASMAALQAKRIGLGKGITKRRYDEIAEQILQNSPDFPQGKLHPIFRSPWFRRVWVFQEVVLARKVVFYCGTHSIAFGNLARAADFACVPYSKLDTRAASWGFHLNCYNVCIRCLRLQEQGEDATLVHEHLLTVLASLDATRPEDKIYGMYGYAKRMKLDWPVPNYTKSVAQIYTELTVAFFRQSKRLWVILVAIGPASVEFGLPSWVPDFSVTIIYTSSRPPRIVMPLVENKQCSGATRCDWTLMPDGRRLRVKGRRFDYIAAVSQPWKYNNATVVRRSTTSDSVKTIYSLLDCISSWFGVALQRRMVHNSGTPIANRDAAVADLAYLFTSGNSSIIKPPDQFAEYLSMFTSSKKENDVVSCASFIVSEDEQGVLGLTPPVQQVFDYIHRLVWKLVFRTAGTSCLGISNHHAKAGDLLVVFYGTSSPCLIRPCAGGFTYIGAAFVDEITNGEFWEAGSSEVDEWFILI